MTQVNVNLNHCIENDSSSKRRFHLNMLKKEESISFFDLFRFGKILDYIYMFLGTIAAIIHGTAVLPLAFLYGDLINTFTNRVLELCPYDLPKLSREYCPPEIILTRENFFTESLKCNFSGSNITIPEFDLIGQVRNISIYFSFVGCAVIILGYFQVIFLSLPGEQQTRRIRRILFQSILHQEMKYFDLNKTNELHIQLSEDLNKIHDGIGEKLGWTIQFLSMFITGLIAGLWRGWKMTLVMCSISPLFVISSIIFSKINANGLVDASKAYTIAGSIAEEVISCIRTVYAYNGQKREIHRYKNHLNQAKKSGIKKGIATGAELGIFWFLTFCVFGLGFWYGAKLIREENFDAGSMLIVFFSLLVAFQSLGQASPHFQAIKEARYAAYNIWKIIDNSQKQSETSSLKPSNLSGSIKFCNVCFSYPSRSNSLILNDLSLNVKQGETIALVGSSGCGKSTCVQLLQGFYPINSGSILIDGISIDQFDRKFLREHIAVVNQEPTLFQMTILENIRLGNEKATDEEIYQAARQANAHEFIIKFPQKYNTIIGQRGATLSGGQKQRIAIARALIRNPIILILDEATSALDNENEKLVQDALENAQIGRTTIIIAHRLSTIRHADQIIVLDNGHVIEQGNDQTLIEMKGIYYNLIQSQKILEENINENEQIQSIQQQRDFTINDKIFYSEERKDDEKENKKKMKKWNIIFQMFRMNRFEWKLILIGCLASIISGGIIPAYGIVVSQLIGIFEQCDKNIQEENVFFYVVMLIIFGIISLFSYFIQNFFFAHSGEQLTERLRLKAFETILKQDISFFDQPSNNPGRLCTQLATEASAVQGGTGQRIGMILQNVATLGIGIIISFLYGWSLTLVSLGFIPLLIIGGFIQSKFLTDSAIENAKALEEANRIAIECIQNIRTVIQLNKEEYFLNLYSNLLDRPYRLTLKRIHIFGIFYGFVDSIVYFAFPALFFLGAHLVQQEKNTFQDILLVYACIFFGTESVGQTVALAPDYGKAVAAASSLFQLFSQKSKIEQNSNDRRNFDHLNGEIQFDQVSFNYSNRPDIKVLQDINLNIKTGQSIGLVGHSGSGKSTIVQLIERFYDPSSGHLMADSNDICSLNLHQYRSEISIVSQEPILFHMSIKENIAYGDTSRKDIPMSEIEDAARKANIDQFIQSLPKGYDTDCGSQGSQLSGGQKQRIAIARALIRNPKILLLDEGLSCNSYSYILSIYSIDLKYLATSALDTDSEKNVQEALIKACENRSSITIAHRLSTIQHVDLIYVIDRGQIVEKGTHSQLLSLKGVYFKMVTQKKMS